MARIAGVNIAPKKHVVIGLMSIYGVGYTTAEKVCQNAGIDISSKVQDLNEEQLEKIRVALQDYRLEGDLKREVSINIKRLMDMGTYRGIRHRRSLPTRGQRTKTNARTRKGPRRPIKK